ncbi:MAG: gluconate 2-dehydrogenase subunit 3 family protein [Gemmatimonadetes bacterium]|nr:gluconate 2-dehydrogenase subunit 3 family protein [Gemmatimonadota bacterium]
MLDDTTSRREFLAASGAALAALWLTADPEEVRASLEHAAHAARSRRPLAWETLTPDEAADVEAIAAQIIPSDGTPGAREAGAVNFIDHSLATWAAPQRAEWTSGLDEINAEVEKRWPGTGRFVRLPAARQIELLKALEKTPFFDTVRTATVRGTFASPEYGGNIDKVGWKLLGYEDRYAWQPPFGAYDAEAATGQ